MAKCCRCASDCIDSIESILGGIIDSTQWGVDQTFSATWRPLHQLMRGTSLSIETIRVAILGMFGCLVYTKIQMVDILQNGLNIGDL